MIFYFRKKLSILIILLFIVTAPLFAQNNLILVESVPEETVLGNEQIPRTQTFWVNMIREARSSIEMEIFYLSHQPGESLTPVIEELEEAAKRGVKIRILADAKMARTYPETLDRLNKIKNIQVRRIDYYNKLGGVMHAKYWILDGEAVFVGSQNVDWRALTQIHELGVWIKSRIIAQIYQHIFNIDWRLAGGEAPSELEKIIFPDSLKITHQKPLTLLDEGRTIQVYPTFSPVRTSIEGMEWDEDALIRLIDQAEKSIQIQLLTYKPQSGENYYAKLDQALRRAAVRGVKVNIIVSNWNVRPKDLAHLKSLQAIPNLDIKISSIPTHSRGHIPFARVEHCKLMVIDDQRLWLGSSNWSYSYFYTSRNVGLVFEDNETAKTVAEIFDKSWNAPYSQILDLCKDYEMPDIAGPEGK
ncbi:MAG: hypothetical protein Kow0037_26160 [Calditrichia bacterium]